METTLTRVVRTELRNELGRYLSTGASINTGNSNGVPQPQVTDFNMVANHATMTRYIAEREEKGFVSSRTDNTPSGSARLGALLKLFWEIKTEGSVYPKENLQADRLSFRQWARQIKALMRNVGVVSNDWRTGITDLQKKYYSFRLEAVISEGGFPVERCVEQWAARLLLQETVKSERQSEKRRRLRRGGAS
ncbi:unnamed protein product [Mucor hiemalis]